MRRSAIAIALIGLAQAQDEKKLPTQPGPSRSPSSSPAQDRTRLRNVRTTRLFADPGPAAVVETLSVSRVGRVAMVVKTKGGQRVLLDGAEQKPYVFIVPPDVLAMAQSDRAKRATSNTPPVDLSDLLRFTVDQQRVYYTAYTGKGYVIAADKYESKVYDYIMPGMPLFSPDSKKIAFAAGRAGRWYVVTNDAESKDYDDIQIGTLVFSPDSRRMAFCARKGGEWRVFHDQGAFPALEGVADGMPVFSPDSKRIAYVCFNKQNRAVVMLDGRALGEYDGVTEKSLQFSPDSKTIVFSAKVKGKFYVVANEKSYGPYDALAEGGPVYSRDGQRLAWAAQTGKSWCVYENGKELARPAGKKREPIVAEAIQRGTPLFSPDGSRLAVGLKRGGSWTLWCQGDESDSFEEILPDTLAFTLDSSKLVFAGLRSKQIYPTINLKEYGSCLDISPLRVSRGENSGSTAWAVKRARTPEQLSAARKADPAAGPEYWTLMLNGEERFGPYDEIQKQAVTLSPDGAHLAVPARVKGKWGIYCDGEARSDGLPIWIRFDPLSNLLEMVAVTKEGYVRMQEVLE
jgi:hypothetical protein